MLFLLRVSVTALDKVVRPVDNRKRQVIPAAKARLINRLDSSQFILAISTC